MSGKQGCERLTVVIDGRECPCERGEYLLDVARRNGIDIPTLCHHPALPDQACCRVCLAEVDTGRGRRRVVTSCIYPVERKCEVFTDSERVREERGMVLALILKHAPAAEDVRALAERYGAPLLGTFVEADDPDNRCVLCGKCVRACRMLGSGAITTVMRGIEKRVATPYDEPSAECVGCGACANVCPTGNIDVVDDPVGGTRTVWGRTFELVPCERCGAPVGTRESVERAAALAGTEPQALCATCRRGRTAEEVDRALP